MRYAPFFNISHFSLRFQTDYVHYHNILAVNLNPAGNLTAQSIEALQPELTTFVYRESAIVSDIQATDLGIQGFVRQIRQAEAGSQQERQDIRCSV